MRLVQVIPREEYNLYAELVRKEADLRRRDLGTWRRRGKKTRDRARWVHSRYPGYVKIAKGMGEVVQLEIKSDAGWQLLDAILGFLDRHLGADISSIHFF